MTKNADRMIGNRDRASQTLARLTDALVHDLTRRAGTRAVSDSPGERGPRGKGSHSDPTLLSVVRAMSDKKAPDVVFDTVKELAQILNEMARLAMSADDKIRYVYSVKERAKEAQVANCKSCERIVQCTPNDRLRSGLCGACYQAQRRAPIPYYVQVTTIHNNSKSPDKPA